MHAAVIAEANDLAFSSHMNKAGSKFTTTEKGNSATCSMRNTNHNATSCKYTTI